MTDGSNSSGKKYSGVEGVFWLTRNQSWQASLRSPVDGKPTFLGTFPEDMLELAKDLVERAKEAPASLWPALRADFRARRDTALLSSGRPLPKRGQRSGQRTRRPRKLTAQVQAGAEIGALIQAAQRADRRVAQAEGELSRLGRQAQDLMKSASEAWDAVAEALKTIGRDLCSGFHDSALGILLDRDPRQEARGAEDRLKTETEEEDEFDGNGAGAGAISDFLRTGSVRGRSGH